MTEAVQQKLSLLHGTWEGSGQGKYPTIDAFEYSETTRFEFDARYPVVHYEQRTVLSDGEPSHWESGFVRWLEDGTVEMSSAQDGGRVEVLRGPLIELDDGFRLELESEVLGHDDRLIRTSRVIELRGERLGYEMKMSTTTTDTPEFQTHLSAELGRAS
jgi:hypothetical protein